MRLARLDALLGEQRRAVHSRRIGTLEDKERLIISSCHPKQRAFVCDLGRRPVALTARGCGKTTAGRARLVLRMLRTPKARCLYIALTREQASELMWAPLKELVEKLGIKARYNETKLKCTFANGSTLRLVGADDKHEIEKLRGIPHHEVGIDEAASFPAQLLEHLVQRILEPRLGDYNGTLWMIGTPGHILAGPFYDITRVGSDISRLWEDRENFEYANWTRWSLHRWGLQDGAPHVSAMARLWAEAQVTKEANGWSDEHPVWRREYLGLWAADDTENVYKYRPHDEQGREWNVWNPPRDPRTGIAILPPGEWEYVFGLDMGHSDPFALEVLAFDSTRADRTLWHVYEFTARRMYAKRIAEMLIGEELDAENPGGIIGALGWPNGMVADMAGLGGAVLEELRSVYGIPIEAAEKKNKHDAIELANGDLVDGRVKVMKGSRLEEQLQNLQWAVNQHGELKENKSQRNDCTDAFVYARRKATHMYADEEPAKKPAPVTSGTTPGERDPADYQDKEPTEDVGYWTPDDYDDGQFEDQWG